MGTLRKIKGQDRWKRQEPKLSEETLQDLHTYAVQDMENYIYDYVAKWGEVVLGLLAHRITINDSMWLTLRMPEIAAEAVKNLASGDAIKILKRDGDSIRVRPTKSSQLPDLQLKILQILADPIFSGRPLTPTDIKNRLQDFRFKFEIKDIRAALSEMKQRGLVKDTKDWRGKKAWQKV